MGLFKGFFRTFLNLLYFAELASEGCILSSWFVVSGVLIDCGIEVDWAVVGHTLTSTR